MTGSVGQQLRQARLERDLTLEHVAEGTHIRLQYLQAIEDGDLDRLPSPVQARGFLRAYASYLNLDINQLSASQESQPTLVSDTQPDSQVSSVQEPETPYGEEEAIFADLGERLQRQRELLGLSLDDIERHTHLRVRYLQALEEGELDELPSTVQGRGMLNNYASFLGLDPDPLLLRFAEGLQSQLAQKQAKRPRRSTAKQGWTPPSLLRRFFSGDFILGGVLILAMVIFVGLAAIRVNALRSVQEPSPTVLSIADALLPTPASTPLPTPTIPVEPTESVSGGASLPTVTVEDEATEEVENAATEEATLLSDTGGAVQVYVVVQQRAWMRVIVDDEIEFEGRVMSGGAYTFTGEEQVELLTGNGAALIVFYNQRELGTIGINGEVVNRIFTAEGILLPTPTITPTGTVAPPSTPLPEPNIIP